MLRQAQHEHLRRTLAVLLHFKKFSQEPFGSGICGHSFCMTTVTTNITLESPIKTLLTNKHDIQTLIKFLDTKGFRSDVINVPVYDRLVALMTTTGPTTSTN